MLGPDSGVLHEFLAVAAKHPSRTAVVHNGRALGYDELRVRASQVAERLGAQPGVVGIPATHSPTTVAGMLGVWLAGGAYCPIDPSFPARRRREMLAAAGCRVVFDPAGQGAGAVDDAAAEHPDGVAYVLFTSGSTGAPKPVLTTHLALTTVVTSLRSLFGVDSGDRVLQFASLNWDTCFEELLPALTAGACLVIDDDAYSGSLPRLLRLVEREQVTVLDLPTAYWHELVHHLADGQLRLPACVRLVIIGGEAASPARLADWRGLPTGHARLVNTYGATETTLITHAIDLHGPGMTGPVATSGAGDPVPIGRPLAHVAEHLGDDGELWIGGPSVAAGYLGLPQATSERFVTLGAQRYFRTGDRVRRSPDGSLVLEGRIDAALKVRGVRVEPAEVEAHIAGHPAVRAVAVVGVRVADHTVLEAYVVARPSAATAGLDASVLAYLRDRVPGHLIPRRIRVVPDLVYTASGKVDRYRIKEAPV